MSMRDYAVHDYGIVAVHDYGIVFGENEFKYAAEVIGVDPEEEDYIAESIDIQSIGEFTGEANPVREDGSVNYNGLSFNNDTLHYASVTRWSTLFKAAYNSMDELVQDVKKSYGEYLPDDFDYKNNIREITGTYYG